MFDNCLRTGDMLCGLIDTIKALAPEVSVKDGNTKETGPRQHLKHRTAPTQSCQHFEVHARLKNLFSER